MKMGTGRLKRGAALALAFLMAFGAMGQEAHAYEGVDTWFVEGIGEAESWGIIPESFVNRRMDRPVTRGEFAEAVVLAYVSGGGEWPRNWEREVFGDEVGLHGDMAYALGIVTGYPDGTFRPEGEITREEMFVMIGRLLGQLGDLKAVDPAVVETVLAGFGDASSVSAWAREAAAVVAGRRIVLGTDLGNLEPQQNTTRAQALVILKRSMETVAPGPVSQRTRDRRLKELAQAAAGTDNTGTDNPGTDDAGTSQEGTWLAYEGSGEPVSDGWQTEGGRYTRLSLEELYTPEELLVMPGTNSVKHALVFGEPDAPFYQTEEEALEHMVAVTVDVWQLQDDGTKTAGRRTLTVNVAVAEMVEAVFREVFEGEERFSIKDVGGYAWRASPTSEHRWGLAIDINANENPLVRSDGTIVVGTHWLPGEDPHSILPDGDVVRAFKKYGFSWGGDAWSQNNDYMHFSFLGK
ncbi:S-layer homology domain-containing protein [Anaerotalea alkaliphila]|uniref:SLH domain-containing protein n=1 Tax=Anaerotalea alkaliphila TaxID=2662126 RepID=A0A7X5HV61_9FIRM|nr:S-layer homology domain-containing protein [Anaerotalea alkaliphila]NDL67245.1 hypothetical protein [Anaerotalea alkaliphila]